MANESETVIVFANFVTVFLSGTLNSDIHVPDSNQKLFADLVADMKKALKKSSAIREGLAFVSLRHTYTGVQNRLCDYFELSDSLA